MTLWTNTDEAAGKPKYLSDTLRNDQTVSDLDATFGVAATEEAVTANKAKGVQHPGWVTVRTYTDAQGNTRYKSETLVAAGSITGDASDDSTLPDLAITIVGGPDSQTIEEGDDVTFVIEATINAALALSYQWQKQTGGTGAWANVTGATEAEITLEAVEAGADGDKYRVVISADGVTTTSSAATLTVGGGVLYTAGVDFDSAYPTTIGTTYLQIVKAGATPEFAAAAAAIPSGTQLTIGYMNGGTPATAVVTTSGSVTSPGPGTFWYIWFGSGGPAGSPTITSLTIG